MFTKLKDKCFWLFKSFYNLCFCQCVGLIWRLRWRLLISNVKVKMSITELLVHSFYLFTRSTLWSTLPNASDQYRKMKCRQDWSSRGLWEHGFKILSVRRRKHTTPPSPIFLCERVVSDPVVKLANCKRR